MGDLKPIAIRALRIVFAIIVAGASLYPALEMWRARFVRPLASRDERADDEKYLDKSRIAAGAQIERRLFLHVTTSRLRAEQELIVKGDANLCRAIHESALRRHVIESRDPVEWAIGSVRVDTDHLQFEPPEVTVTEGTGDCSIRTSIKEQRIFRNEDTESTPSDLVVFDVDRLRANDLLVVFDATEVRVGGMKAPSRLASGGLAFHWKDEPKQPAPQSVSFRITRAAGAQLRIGDVVTGVDQNWLPYLGPPFTAILIALPYALFIVYGRRLATAQKPLIEMAGWMLTLYLFLHLTFVVVSVDDWLFHQKLRDQKLQPFVGGDTFGAVFTAFACVVWPLLIMRWWRKGRPSFIAELDPGIPRSGIVAMTAFAIATGLAIYTRWAPRDWWAAREELISALGVIALAAGCYWLMREVGGGIVHALLLLLTSSALFLLSGPYAPAMTLPLAALFLLGLMIVVRAGFAHGRKLSGTALVLSVAIVAVAVRMFIPSSFFMPYWEIHSLVESANNAAMLVLAAAFLILLRDHSDAGKSSGDAIELGFAFALAIIYNHRYGVYGAVVVGSGYLLLRYLLFPKADNAQFLPGDAAKIRDGIAKLIALHEVERAIDKRRKAVLAKVEDGTEEWAKYETSTTELEAVLSSYQQDTAAIETSQRALAHGPIDPPWQRGTYAASYAAALAIPWCIGYAAVFSRDNVPSSPQWWLDVIATFILGILQWPLFGFFFGYFYPEIRGRSGLSKALFTFVTIAVPPVLAFLIFRGELPPMLFALWIFQNFIQAMVLGLFAGDYRMLRRYGLGWRHLRDVHDLGVLAAYGSSVIVAIGGAIATAVAGGVVDAFTKMLPK